jgi:hypothetical protein
MKTIVLAALCSVSLAAAAHAATVDEQEVFAQIDSTNLAGLGPVGGSTDTFLDAGQSFSITASGSWSLDGSNFFGPNGTTLYGSANLPGIGSVLFGTLMGQIGSAGPYFVVGSSFSGVAGAAGELFLRVLDNDFSNNAGFVTAVITYADTQPTPSPVPLPAGMWLGLTGIAALVAARRRAA